MKAAQDSVIESIKEFSDISENFFPPVHSFKQHDDHVIF